MPDLPTADPISRVDKFLAGVTAKPPSRGNLIFALDATGSREPTWDMAMHLQAQMFKEVAAIGTLDIMLIYFRGTHSIDAECKASNWMSDPAKLAAFMTSIKCRAGATQLGRVLEHALREAGLRKVGAVVYVGDAFEEEPEQILAPARKLGQLGVPVFLFQEGRDIVAETYFQDIAKITGGAYRQFGHGSAEQLGELLRAVAAFAVGGVAELERQGSEAAGLLLGQIR